ncbi:MAG TPA: phenylalanine--tRNA ligase subunit beta [Thermoanaerobaculia bacterium]|nr:phenylalanine--tRNA ligase subunit beta [Thermoanaerobaculia bacterium]
MKLSRDWLNDYVDLSGVSDEQLMERMTEIGHAIEATEKHGDDTVVDAEITTNRIDAMSHAGMAKELAAALGRQAESLSYTSAGALGRQAESLPYTGVGQALSLSPSAHIRIDAPEMCSRFTARVIRNVTIKPSPAHIARRLEAVGLRPISNVVDVTNYVMLALGHPMHAYDLDLVTDQTIIVRAGKKGESIKCLDNVVRAIDPDTCVISDAKGPTGLGGIIGGFNSEIRSTTTNLLLECAAFNPSVIRRTARRLGVKTDASYRFERGVDPNDGPAVIELATKMILELAGGTAEELIDVIAREIAPKRLRLRASKLHEQSGGSVGIGYALELFRRLGFTAEMAGDDLDVIVPTSRGDIGEEMDLVEEVLRFFGLNNVPATLPRLTTGDAHENPIGDAEDQVRDILAGCGLSEAVTYSFIHAEVNALVSDERPITITNALTENIASMRLSLLPGLLEVAAFNRSYGTRDGGLFEVGRTYHQGSHREHHGAAFVMYGSIGTFWGDRKRDVDFFDVKGIVEQIAEKLHVPLTFKTSDDRWYRAGQRAGAWYGDRRIGSVGFLAPELLQHYGIKGDVAAAEIDIEALLASVGKWTMAPVARFPGMPMILAVTHGRDLEYGRIIETIRTLDVPWLHEVGLRDRFEPEGEENLIKTTLGMWYQAFDHTLTQDEVGDVHQRLASRVAELLPVKLL